MIGGGISQADIATVVIPQATAQMDRIMRAECARPTGKLPCGCLADTRADVLQNAFDVNRDCTITIDEIERSTIVESLLAPDVEHGGQDLLSFGVAIELVSATFTAP